MFSFRVRPPGLTIANVLLDRFRKFTIIFSIKTVGYSFFDFVAVPRFFTMFSWPFSKMPSGYINRHDGTGKKYRFIFSIVFSFKFLSNFNY